MSSGLPGSEGDPISQNNLKVTLLTEQKAAKLIDLLEELRRDLPNVKDRHDPTAVSLKKAMDPDRVLALNESIVPGKEAISSGPAKE